MVKLSQENLQTVHSLLSIMYVMGDHPCNAVGRAHTPPFQVPPPPSFNWPHLRQAKSRH